MTAKGILAFANTIRRSRRDLLYLSQGLLAATPIIVNHLRKRDRWQMANTMQEDVEFASSDGLTLRATHRKVKQARANCLFLHGITTNRNEHLDFHKRLAERLTEVDVASLLLDFRAHGKSDGRQIDFSPVGECVDASSAVEFLTRHYDLARVPLTIVGTSFGAFPAIFCARRFPDLVRQLFLFAPVVDYRRTFLEPETEWAKESFTRKALNEIETSGFLLLDGHFRIGSRLVYEMMVIDPVREAQQISQPILLVHGQQDSMVPIQTSVEFARRVPRAHLIEMDKMDHGFEAPGDEGGTSQGSIENLRSIEERLCEFVLRSVR